MMVRRKLMETNKQFYEIQHVEASNKNLYTSNAIQIGIGLPKIKSHVKIGNIVFHNTKHFNWFHRFTLKLFFGLEIENLKEN
jgi:hypothetical protein